MRDHKESGSSSGVTNGLGLGGVLGVVFIVLKLTRHIDWSWLWVLSPFWIPFAVGVAAILLYVLLLLIGRICFGARDRSGLKIRRW